MEKLRLTEQFVDQRFGRAIKYLTRSSSKLTVYEGDTSELGKGVRTWRKGKVHDPYDEYLDAKYNRDSLDDYMYY